MRLVATIDRQLRGLPRRAEARRRALYARRANAGASTPPPLPAPPRAPSVLEGREARIVLTAIERHETKAWLRDQRWRGAVTAAALIIGLYLLDVRLNMQTGELAVGFARIAADNGCSPTTAQAAIRQLEAIGFLSVQKRWRMGVDRKGARRPISVANAYAIAPRKPPALPPRRPAPDASSRQRTLSPYMKREESPALLSSVARLGALIARRNTPG